MAKTRCRVASSTFFSLRYSIFNVDNSITQNMLIEQCFHICSLLLGYNYFSRYTATNLILNALTRRQSYPRPSHLVLRKSSFVSKPSLQWCLKCISFFSFISISFHIFVCLNFLKCIGKFSSELKIPEF